MGRFRSGDLLFGKYRIQRLLARGGFAEVYLAEHLHLHAPRALKVLTRGGRVTSGVLHKAAQRFRLEAQLGARFAHEPHIVRVYDFEQDEPQGLLVLVMEYMPGGSLKDRLRQAREQGLPGLPVEEVVRTAYHVARGLAVLHRAELVHRDVKPSNILYDAEGQAKIADLGIVQMPHGLTRRSELGDTAPRHPGTPEYMSPEQEGTVAYLPPASDIYSLGVTLFEALTLRRYKHLKPGTRVRELRPEVPAWLDDLLARMLARDPEARPWDGEELAQILVPYMSEMTSSVALTPSTPSQEENLQEALWRTPRNLTFLQSLRPVSPLRKTPWLPACLRSPFPWKAPRRKRSSRPQPPKFPRKPRKFPLLLLTRWKEKSLRSPFPRKASPKKGLSPPQ